MPDDSVAVIRRLRDSAPGYEKWVARQEGIYPEDEELEYIQASNLALYAVEMAKANLVEDLPSLFAAAEELLAIDDDVISNLVVVGFLEAVQNYALNRDVSLDRLTEFLGDLSFKRWVELLDGWSRLSVELRKGRL